MKKILLTTLEFPPQVGGIATYVKEFARRLHPSKVIVYAPHREGGRVYDEGEKYTIIRKKPLTSFFWPRWIPAIVHFFSIVKKEQIELVVVNHVLPLGYAAWVLKKFKKIPYIIMSHGTDMFAASSHPWKKRMLKKLVAESEQIIFNSESIKRRFLERLPEFEHKSAVMYPSPDAIFGTHIEESVVENLRRSLALEGKKVILSVARLDRGKGFQHLVHAIPEILEKEPHTVWVIVGDGPNRAEIFEAVQKLSLQNVVRFVGAIPHEELAIYYRLADVFVLLTHTTGDREEGLGLVFLEAASAGVPVIAGKTGGVAEAVQDGVTGRVFDVYHEAQKVVQAIIELLGNSELRKKFGSAGEKRVQEVFQWNIQLKRLEPWIGPIEFS